MDLLDYLINGVATTPTIVKAFVCPREFACLPGVSCRSIAWFQQMLSRKECDLSRKSQIEGIDMNETRDLYVFDLNRWLDDLEWLSDAEGLVRKKC